MTDYAEELRLTAISLTAGADKAANVAQAIAAIDQAAATGADWVQLPEMFSFIGPYPAAWEAAESESGPLLGELRERAMRHRIILIAGTIGERPTPEEAGTPLPTLPRRIFNTCWIIGRDGNTLAKYRKVHLFNLRSADGKPLHCESDGFLAGSSPVTVDIDGWRVGLSICYDLRFPEFFGALAARGPGPCDLLLAPSAFTKATGEAHWHLLLRARAVEWQCFVFAANQVGEHGLGKESYGHAAIVDPWGQVIADSGDRPGLCSARINRQMLTAARGRLPALADRRPEVYRR